jgi:hypothetical protein
LPKKVCQLCLSGLLSASSIKQTCINSDKVLKAVVGKVREEESLKIEFDSESYIYEVVKIETLKQGEISEIADEPTNVEFVYDESETSQLESHEEPKKSQKKISSFSHPIKCYICNERFQFRKQKNDHLDLVHNYDEFKCHICRQKSQTARGHDNHLMLHENPELLSHLCHLCSKNYQKACDLRRHIKLSHTDKSARINNYLCDLCDFKTFLKMNMKRHIRTIHLKIKAFQCEFCPNKKYTSKITLDQHKISHHGLETDFICMCCARKFPTMSFLRSHMKLCSGSPSAVRVRGDPNSYREQIENTDNYRCKICSIVVVGKGKIAQVKLSTHSTEINY